MVHSHRAMLGLVHAAHARKPKRALARKLGSI